MYQLPFDPADVKYILNYFNHGARPELAPDGYLRDGVYCVTGDGDNSKQTYWRGGYSHNGTDFAMEILSPVYSPCDGYVTGADKSLSAGLHCEVRTLDLPGSRLYFRFLHLQKLEVKTGDYVNAGELIGLSGASGWCGDPHLHYSIATSSGGGNIDPLTDSRFKHYLQGIPYAPRQDHIPAHIKPFASNSPVLTVNGKAGIESWYGDECEYNFHCTEPILRLLNVSKITGGGFEDIENYDLISELGASGALDSVDYNCIIVQKAEPGIYYYQANTGKGWSTPVRIMLHDRIIL